MRHELPDCLKPVPGTPWRRPLDQDDVAVRLETEGITDGVARADWGYSSTWEIARDCYGRLSGSEEVRIQRPSPSEMAAHFKGMLFALPLALCCLSMVLLKFSLWGGDLASDVAAAVAVGTVTSFVVTGGIVQAMARQGLFYAGTGEMRMSEIVCLRWMGYGIAALAGSALIGIGLSAFFGWLPSPLDWTAAAFHMSLGLFWLATGILYMLERNLLVTVAAVIGIAVVGILHVPLHIALIPSQLSGILVAGAFSLLMARRLLRARAAADSGRVHRQMPMRTLYLTAPYLVYGCLYYLFLFADRLMAWSAQTEVSALPLVFRGDYELPLDIALFAFVLQVGWVHSSMVRFYDRLQLAQQACEIHRVGEFNSMMQRFYVGRLIRFLPMAAAMSALVWVVAHSAGLLNGVVSARVTMLALMGYPFLVIGLWNVSLLFALSLPKAVLPAIGTGMLGDATIGYLLSRTISYEWAAAGFTVGAMLFGILSAIMVHRRFRQLDYFYFASAA